MSEGEWVFLDACSLINLFATGRIEEILGDLSYRFGVSEYVAEREVIRIEDPTNETETRLLAFDRLKDAGLLTVLALESEDELAMCIRLAASLDDGEASICALALCRGGAVATDDRKAIRVVEQLRPRVPVLQTPELLFEWARRTRRSEGTMKGIVQAVRSRARFLPAVSAPHADWWRRLLE